jgi:hypothetical protein
LYEGVFKYLAREVVKILAAVALSGSSQTLGDLLLVVWDLDPIAAFLEQ